MIEQFLTRDKFKTEIGRQTFDELCKISSSYAWIYIILKECKGDEKRKPFLNWLKVKNRTEEDVEEYLNIWEE